MSAYAMSVGFCRRMAWVGLLVGLATSAGGATVMEKKFPLLQIGTQFFTNATVTTHTSNYVFIIHSGGMANIKVANLDDEAREKLGYVTAAQRAHAATTNSVLARARTKVASLQADELRNLKQSWTAYLPKTIPSPRSLPLNILLVCGAVLLLGHLFFSFCCKCICEKAGIDSGPAIWLPILQIVPMLRAAGMAPVWFLAFIIPGLNLIAQIVWSFKIVQARGKSPVVAVGLILPLTNVLSFLYLAFSGGGPNRPEQRAPQIMTLEAA
jgi:hypothetical protein